MSIRCEVVSHRVPADVPVIILNWNGWEHTFACLRSIQNTGENHEVWLVDNGSVDDRSAEAQAIYPGLRCLKWDDNFGWAGGYNRALSIAEREGYKFAYLLNNDCSVAPRFLDAALQLALADKNLAAVGSRIGYIQPAGFTMFDGQFHAPGDKRMEEAPVLIRASGVSGAAMLVRLESLRSVGYFDERFFCYFEETEWCFRAGSVGWRIGIAGASLVLHNDRGSDRNENACYYMLRNQILMQRLSGRTDSGWNRMWMVYSSLRAANEERRVGNMVRARAIVAALWDALWSRYGRRGADPPRPILWLLTHFWIFPSGYFRTKTRKARRLIGRAGLVSRQPPGGA